MLLSLAALIDRKHDIRPAFCEADKVLRFCDLYAEVAKLAASLEQAPATIGLLAKNSLDWVIADLAVCAAGKTLVPLPSFFSAAQIQHIAEDADIGLFLCDAAHEERIHALKLPVRLLGSSTGDSVPDLHPAKGAQRIIYTSGTPASPKA